MARCFTCLIAAAVVATAAPAHAGDMLRLAPSSKWHVNYADDSCRLARSFGTGDDQVVLVLDRFRPGPIVHMTLTGRPMTVHSDMRRITLRFGPDDPAFEKGFTPGTLDDGKAALVLTGGLWIAGYDPALAADEEGEGPRRHRAVDPALYERIRFLDLQIPGKQAIRLETGSMASAEQTLAACTDDLLRGWGIDAAAHKSLSRRVAPVGSPGDWMNRKDYPREMLRGRYQGLVHFRLIVDEQGKPRSCHIQQSTRPKEFDDAVCKGMMARAQFEPALDAAGKPVASYYVNRVRFKI